MKLVDIWQISPFQKNEINPIISILFQHLNLIQNLNGKKTFKNPHFQHLGKF